MQLSSSAASGYVVEALLIFTYFGDWNNGFYSGPTINLGIRW